MKHAKFLILTAAAIVISTSGVACGYLKATQTEMEAETAIIDNGAGVQPVAMGAPPRDRLQPSYDKVSEIYKFLAVRDPQVLQIFPQAFSGAQNLDQLFALPFWNIDGSSGLAVPIVKFELNVESLSGSTWGANEAATGSNIRLWFEVARTPPLLPYKMNLKNSSIQSARLTQVQTGVYQLEAHFSSQSGYILEVFATTVRRPIPSLVPFGLAGTVRFTLVNGVTLPSSGILGTFDVSACPVFAGSYQAASVLGCFN